jgi:hypothetical protein
MKHQVYTSTTKIAFSIDVDRVEELSREWERKRREREREREKERGGKQQTINKHQCPFDFTLYSPTSPFRNLYVSIELLMIPWGRRIVQPKVQISSEVDDGSGHF